MNNNIYSLLHCRPSSPSQRVGMVSFTESSPRLRTSSYNQAPDHLSRSFNHEQESLRPLSASPRTGSSSSSMRDPSPELDNYQDLSVLRARSLSPRPNSQEPPIQDLSVVRPRAPSPRPSALRDTPPNGRSPSPRPSREGPEHPSLVNGRNSFRGSEDRLVS